VVAEDGKVTGAAGHGQILSRDISDFARQRGL
jgi:dihydropyrimidinase